MHSRILLSVAAAALGVMSALAAELVTQTAIVVSEIRPFAASGAVTISDAIQREGVDRVPLKQLRPARAGDEVSTGKDGALSFTLGAGAEYGTARMESESRIMVPELDSRDYALELLKGSLFLDITNRKVRDSARREFRLKTPGVVLAVRGTRFFCRATNERQLVGVHAGDIALEAVGRSTGIVVTAGDVAEVINGAVGVPRRMTDDERSLEDMYAKAQLARMGIDALVPGQRRRNGAIAHVLWTRFKAYANIDALASCTPASRGASGVEYKLSNPPEGMQHFSGFANLYVPRGIRENSTLLSIVFTCECTGFNSVKVALSGDTHTPDDVFDRARGEENGYYYKFALTSGKSNTITVPVPTLINGKSVSDLYLLIEFHGGPGARRSLSQVLQVSLYDFAFLMVPQ